MRGRAVAKKELSSQLFAKVRTSQATSKPMADDMKLQVHLMFNKHHLICVEKGWYQSLGFVKLDT
jgi:hypothetical protein